MKRKLMKAGATAFLTYKGQALKMVQFEDESWWALRDMCRIFDFNNVTTLAGRIDEDNRKMFLAESGIGGAHGTHRSYFVNKAGLDQALTFVRDKEEATEFKTWIEKEILPNLDRYKPSEEVAKNLKGSLSLHASFHKAQMLIRIAENKAVPHSEQLRLLSIAAQLLTGTGFSAEKENVLEDAQSADEANQPEEENMPRDIMDLPEVVGFIHNTEEIVENGFKVYYYPAEVKSHSWCYSRKRLSLEEFNELANTYGFKIPELGYWKRVMTPKGEAREFMYAHGGLIDFIRIASKKTA